MDKQKEIDELKGYLTETQNKLADVTEKLSKLETLEAPQQEELDAQNKLKTELEADVVELNEKIAEIEAFIAS